MVGGTQSCGMSFQGTLRCRALALVGSGVVAIDDVWEMVRTSHVMIADSLSTRLNFGSLAHDRTRSTPSSSSQLDLQFDLKVLSIKNRHVSNAELESPDSNSADLSIFCLVFSVPRCLFRKQFTTLSPPTRSQVSVLGPYDFFPVSCSLDAFIQFGN
jgi:hypothetical protein